MSGNVESARGLLKKAENDRRAASRGLDHDLPLDTMRYDDSLYPSRDETLAAFEAVERFRAAVHALLPPEKCVPEGKATRRHASMYEAWSVHRNRFAPAQARGGHA
jgi:hypothetical protein